MPDGEQRRDAEASIAGAGTQYNVTGSGTQLLHSGRGDQNVNSGLGTQINYVFRGYQIPEPDVVQDCQKSLAFSEMNDRPNDIAGAIDGTCEWLLQHETFQNWTKSDRSLLWIKGKPGSGKSTLLKYMLRRTEQESIQQGSTIVLSFFFHGRGTELQKSLLRLFRSLLHQLLVRVPESLSTLVDTFKTRCNTVGTVDEKWKWHAGELQEFFASALPKALSKESICLFVDALDECGEENAVDLIDYLKVLINKLAPTTPPFRVCFSCRHYPILQLDYGLTISMEPENNGDIATYVRTQLSTLDKRSASTITETITHKARGVFMWARLVVKAVLALKRQGEGLMRIQAEIRRIPPDLDDLYAGLLQSMEQRARSKRLIQWICFSTSPLSIDELRWAMAVDPDCSHTSLQQCEESEEYIRDSEAMERKINKLSCGLAETVLSSELRIVQFIHQSVEDFFLTKGLSALATFDGVQLSNSLAASRAHYELYWTCIRYLRMDEVKRIATKPFEDDESMSEDDESMSEDDESMSEDDERMSEGGLEFLEYATVSWTTHARLGDIEGVHQHCILESLNWPTETFLQLWMPLYRRIENCSDSFGDGTSLLHVASSFGLEQMVSTILKESERMGIDIDCRDAGGWTPLTYAVSEGHEGIVVSLLDSGKFDIEAEDDLNRTPLWLAAWHGRKDIVTLLIDMGKIHINAKDSEGRTPLFVAVLKGHESVIQLLIDTGEADVEAKDERGRTPFWWAAWMGHAGTLMLLLRTGAVDINVRDSEGRTPLHQAVWGGHEGVLQLLIDMGGVDLEARDDGGRTPFWWAALGAHVGILMLLLRAGTVDINARDNNGCSPLQQAARRWRIAVIRLLKNMGAV